MIQAAIATIIVLAAIVWLARRCYHTISSAVSGKASSCGACGNCAKTNSSAKPLAIAPISIKNRASSEPMALVTGSDEGEVSR